MLLRVNLEHKYNSGLTEFSLCGQKQWKNATDENMYLHVNTRAKPTV